MPLSRNRHRSAAARWAVALLGTTILAGIAPAQAQDLHWNGSVSNDMDDPANWDEGQTPSPTTTLVVNNVTNPQATNAPLLDHDQPIYRTEVGTVASARAQYYITSSQFFSGDSTDGRANDAIGANGASGVVHVVGGAWRSLGMDLGFGANSQGIVAVEQDGRLESGDVALGRNGGNGTLSLNLGSTLLGGDIVMGDVQGGWGQFDVKLSTAQIGDLKVTNGTFDALGSTVTAHDIRLSAPDFHTQAKATMNGSGLDATRLLIGGEAASGGNPAQVGSGSLEFANGILITHATSVVGTGTGSSGAIVLADSSWNFGGDLYFGAAGGSGEYQMTRGLLKGPGVLLAGVGEDSVGTIYFSQSAQVDISGLTLGSDGGNGALTADLVSFISAGQGVRIGVSGEGFAAGTGAIKLSSGAHLITGDGDSLIGSGAGSRGSVSLDGTFTTFQATGLVAIGDHGGAGDLTLTDRAVFTSTNMLDIGRGAGSQGQVTASAGSAIDATQIALGTNAGTGRLDSDASTVTIGEAHIGTDGGIGGVFLSNQSLLASHDMTIGFGENAFGHLVLNGSNWAHQGGIDLGVAGGSGLVDLFTGTAATVDLQGAALRLGNGGMGVIHVDGAGTSLALTGGGFLMGSNGGTGGLTARNGGAFTSGTGLAAGIGTGSNGVLAAIGEDSSVLISGPVLMGAEGGSGYIVASGGATVNIGTNISTNTFGEGPGSRGGVNVDSGARVELHGEVSFGGAIAGGSATSFIDGAGSQFSTLDGVFAMTAGDVEVTNGGRLFNGGGADVTGLGGGQSTITVSGAGSLWAPASDTYIGGQYNGDGNPATPGRGMVSILDGASLAGGNARIHLASAGGTGTLAIDMNASATAGEYDQGAGGTLIIGIDPNTNGRSGSLSSDGSITFADGSHITFVRQATGRYHIGDRYRIAYSRFDPIAHGEIVFDGLEQQSLFVGLVPVFEALGPGEALYLDVSQTRSFASAAATPNQAAAGAGADSLANANAIKAAILDLATEGEAQGAFDALSGELYASVRTALIEDSRLPRLAVLDRLSDAEGGSGAWAQGFGNWGSNGGDGNAATLNRNSKGALIGADVLLGDTGLRLGAAGGYTDGDLHVDPRASHADIKTTHALGYLGGAWGGLRVRIGGGYAWSRIDTNRAVAFPGFADSLRARYDAHTLQGFGEIGYQLPVATGWVEPFAGVTAVRVTADGVTEKGGAAALTIGRSRLNDRFASVGVRGSAAISGPVVAGFSLAWQHRFENDLAPLATMRLASGTAFGISGAPLARDQANAELSLGWRITPGTELRASYSGAIGGRTADNAARLSLTIGF